MELTCSCGSKDFKPLKFGGRKFYLQMPDRINLFNWSGFEPDIWVCKSCKRILFSLNEEDFDKIS